MQKAVLPQKLQEVLSFYKGQNLAAIYLMEQGETFRFPLKDEIEDLVKRYFVEAQESTYSSFNEGYIAGLYIAFGLAQETSFFASINQTIN